MNREHVFSIGHPGFQTICKAGDDIDALKSSNAQILVKAVSERLKKPDTIVEANLRLAYVDSAKFVKLCRAQGWTVMEIEAEPVFQEICYAVRSDPHTA